MKNTAASRKMGRHKRYRGATLGITGRFGGAWYGPGGCNHALAQYEEVTDTNGRTKIVSYGIACQVRHTKRHNGTKWVNAQPHKDSTGREWE
jgi:hypothetical protein